MNKLEHANIVVTAIEPTLNFLKIVFPDWRVRGQGWWRLAWQTAHLAAFW